jgi:hypothetical protein
MNAEMGDRAILARTALRLSGLFLSSERLIRSRALRLSVPPPKCPRLLRIVHRELGAQLELRRPPAADLAAHAGRRIGAARRSIRTSGPALPAAAIRAA